MSCSVISQLPTDVLLNNILTHLDAASLVQLSLTSRLFAQLCQDELLWKHLVLDDFHIPLDATFRQMGWKKLYARLNDSRVYTWGENADSRLGLPNPDLGTHRFFNSRSVSTPQELISLRGKNIVDIVAGGWSFHALDKYGYVWMWGTLQKESSRLRSLGSRLVREPAQVQFPHTTHIVSISAGRSHAIALAQDGSVWHWSNIWKPQRIRLPPSLQHHSVVQVSANWGQSSILTSNGDLVVVPLPDMVPPTSSSLPPDTLLDDETTPIITLDYLRRDDLIQREHQHLPSLDSATLSSSSGSPSSSPLSRSATIPPAPLARPVLQGDKIVQIAGMEHDTLALSCFGRVYKVNVGAAKVPLAPTSFTVDYVHFGAQQVENNQRSHFYRFISASFHSFAVYTLDGQVLLGKHDDPFDQQPKMLASQGICKVSFGDYHCGALTNQGELLTWGAFSAGALGHGEQDDDNITESPLKVEAFNDMYVFAIGFGGWHSAVLAIPKADT